MAIILEGIEQSDRNQIENILRSTDFFYEFEIQTALEIADETLQKGMEKSGYFWVKVIDDGEVLAFANYGKNSFSTHSWDLYWIAVHMKARNKKLGSALLRAVEENVKKSGGKILWIETSGRPLYASTEAFYRRNGYDLQASLKDFYGPGDPKQIYSKVLSAG
ncbi:MAG TPA: GNAT family N-acetyltransferase [Bacteroidales bacterium]|nr:GNAT family N-acetyltransferase [Bacteroidales bacterium]HPF03304.1 GNAT family N-acetyltransferase [Bacteroidales bacterium]HPJ58647.1 GNAT family N-acetyltransferase [Bacteroidales bacterium]HPR11194.1 GNAT family N-acetyltransferase [Bacteroidales bacterium]HRW86497.1 GNAT family N-acetyltransferase [Bacteroidales bacterium]